MVKPQEDSDRLKALIGSRRRGAFALQIKLQGGASMLSQHMSGNRPISLDAGIRYARGLGVPLDAISPRLAEELRAGLEVLGAGSSAIQASEPPPRWSGSAAPDDVIDGLGKALGAAPPALREAIAVNLAGWAREGGLGPWPDVLRTLLFSPSRKLQANGR